VALTLHDPRGDLTIETVEGGDAVGWSWLFEPYRWHFDAVAVEPVRAVAIDGACLRGKCDADHELGYALMRRFAGIVIDRLQHTRIRLLDVYGARDRD
jgi:CRP-like cAMP-binding protein